jgi:hypothetical protein
VVFVHLGIMRSFETISHDQYDQVNEQLGSDKPEGVHAQSAARPTAVFA